MRPEMAALPRSAWVARKPIAGPFSTYEFSHLWSIAVCSLLMHAQEDLA